MNVIDTVEDSGLVDISTIEYKGNFNVKFKSKEQLEMLQKFFGVRRSQFNMDLLETRPEITKVLKEFNYAKNING